MDTYTLVPVEVAAAALGLSRLDFVREAAGHFRSSDIVAPLSRLLELGVVPGDLVAELLRGSVREAHARVLAA